MTLRLYTHPACLEHDTGVGHAECGERLTVILETLRAHFAPAHWAQAPPAIRSALERVHTLDMVASILDRPVDTIHWLDPDTALSPGSAQAALHAAGAVCTATDWVLGGEHRRAFCVVRPPGHHATADTPMGFCLFNSIAVGVAQVLAQGAAKRVAIADFDVHHGNGTQDIFLRDPRVLFASSHQWPLYPGSGHAEDAGIGNTLNAQLAPLSARARFRQAWEQVLLPRLDAFQPDLLFISAGFDAHRADPLAQLLLETEDFGWVTARLVEVADRHAHGRVVSSLEGGYALDALGDCALAHARALAGD